MIQGPAAATLSLGALRLRLPDCFFAITSRPSRTAHRWRPS